MYINISSPLRDFEEFEKLRCYSELMKKIVEDSAVPQNANEMGGKPSYCPKIIKTFLFNKTIP